MIDRKFWMSLHSLKTTAATTMPSSRSSPLSGRTFFCEITANPPAIRPMPKPMITNRSHPDSINLKDMDVVGISTGPPARIPRSIVPPIVAVTRGNRRVPSARRAPAAIAQ